MPPPLQAACCRAAGPLDAADRRPGWAHRPPLLLGEPGRTQAQWEAGSARRGPRRWLAHKLWIAALIDGWGNARLAGGRPQQSPAAPLDAATSASPRPLPCPPPPLHPAQRLLTPWPPPSASVWCALP